MFVLPDYKGFIKKPPEPKTMKPSVDKDGFQEVKRRPRKRPKKKNTEDDATNSDASMIDSENIYESLPEDSDGNEIQTTKPVKKKEIKLPPITITQLNIAQVYGECNKLNLNKNLVRFVMTSEGIKIHSSSLEEFEKLKKHLIDNKIQFYTHMLKNQIQTKIVLYGLPHMETAAIKAKLSEHNLEPSEIKILNIKNPRYNDQCHYLLYFEKSKNVRINDVRELKSLFNLGIKWEYFSKRNLGPTQCGNCFRFGHGSKDCFLKANCIKCGQSHNSSTCIFNLPTNSKDEKPKIPKNKIKCANCWGNHTANFSGCPARLQYLARIDKIRQRSKNIREYSRSQSNNPPFLNDINFPSLINSNAPTWNVQPPNLNSSYSSQLNSLNSSKLLTPAECMLVLNELVTKLSNCNSRVDQIRAIGEIALKYIN